MLTGKYLRGESGRLHESEMYERRYNDPRYPDVTQRFVEYATQRGDADFLPVERQLAGIHVVVTPVAHALQVLRNRRSQFPVGHFQGQQQAADPHLAVGYDLFDAVQRVLGRDVGIHRQPAKRAEFAAFQRRGASADVGKVGMLQHGRIHLGRVDPRDPQAAVQQRLAGAARRAADLGAPVARLDGQPRPEQGFGHFQVAAGDRLGRPFDFRHTARPAGGHRRGAVVADPPLIRLDQHAVQHALSRPGHSIHRQRTARRLGRHLPGDHLPDFLGQRIERFSLEWWDGTDWLQFTQGTTVGYKRILTFPAVTARRVRLTIAESRTSPALSSFGLYKSPAAR